MRAIVTAAEMRALERATIDELGLPGAVLMETAGRAVAAAALRLAPRGAIAVVCGPGGNGGDGWVAARVLRAHGARAVAYRASPEAAIGGDARLHLRALVACGGEVVAIDTPEALAAAAPALAAAALVVDALLGIGVTRPVTGHLAAVIAAMMAAPARLAVDVPSGLDADTGAAAGAAVRADATVTFAALKPALCGAPGFVHAGAVEVAEIGVPAARVEAAARAFLVEREDVVGALPRAAPLDHKGRRGHVAVVAGSPGMRGAGRLAALAALRAGAGLCTLAADGPGELVADDAVMTRRLQPGPDAEPGPGADPDADEATAAADDHARIAALLAGKAAVVIGCGLGRGPRARRRVAQVLASDLPAVLDADALAALGDLLDAPGPDGEPPDAPRAAGRVLTPHPGEASRLLRTTAAAVEADRFAAARALALRTGAVVVLKGARTVVCDPSGRCTVNPTGSAALATAGSGDVLAGVIGGLLAQGLAPRAAAEVACFAHGLAGEALADAFGDRGVVASDLPAAVARALAQLARR